MLHAKILAIIILLAGFLGSCKKSTTELSPAEHISKSETLIIPAAVAVDANLPKGTTRVATYYATGVQKYVAQLIPGTTPAQYEWVFTAPQADLFDASNKKVGTHGAGPYWQVSANDSLFAQQFAPARKAPSPDSKSIDWLLLMPKTGKTPTGIFAGVAFIQRIATAGGKAPAIPPAQLNATDDVPYTAVYRFTKLNQ